MGNAAYRSSTAVSAQLGATFSVGKPAGTADGDLLTAFQISVVSGGDSAPATPTGWTLKDSLAFGIGSYLQRFEKPASSEPASWTFNNSNDLTPDTSVYVICSSPGPTASEGGGKATGTGTTADPGVYTTAVANELLLACWGIGLNTSATITPDGSFTALGEIGDNTRAMNVGYKSQASAGNTANTGATVSTSLAWGAMLVAIPPTPTPANPEGWETVAPEKTWENRRIPVPY